LVPGTRLKLTKQSRPSELIQQRINIYQQSQEMPKNQVAYQKRHLVPSTLSEGCVPRRCEEDHRVAQIARATQLQHVIQLVLRRDRLGLAQLARRINVAALVGKISKSVITPLYFGSNKLICCP